MKILLKSAEIIDKNSPYHFQKKNIIIVDGKIEKIGDSEETADIVLESPNLKVSPGWFDLRASIKDPGSEHKEDIHSATRAAASGGFTGMVCMPNTKPVLQTKDLVEYISNRSANKITSVYPVAAVTVDNKGEEITEMIDLHKAGAIAFSDGNKPIWHSDVLLKTLQYLQSFNGLLLVHAEDKYVSMYGQMNEGFTSTLLGLKGLPKLAEEIIVERDLRILRYTGGKIHFSHVSSPRSLELIKQAKAEGLNVTSDITAYNLALDDTLLTSFDTNLKVNPPLRSREDVDAFWNYLRDGVIDAIVSDHNPQDEESKNLEFDLAEFGMIGLESVFSIVNTIKRDISLETLLDKISFAPRRILGLPQPVIKEGELAEITIFDSEKEWEFTKNDIKSKSKNTPFVGWKFKGKPLAVVNKGMYFINN
ncbi:MAG: dihydroorotase [Sporocytophaga sp.]|nr:dihydroorotase [Sporocytophaga sp.]